MRPMSEDAEAGGFPEHFESGCRTCLGDRFRREPERDEQQAEQQMPGTMVIGCCDRRVSPGVIFDASPGEFFVVHDVAHHGTAAAIEFATRALKVRRAVVLVHGRCGGVKAFAEEDFAPFTANDPIGEWMEIMAPATLRAGPTPPITCAAWNRPRSSGAWRTFSLPTSAPLRRKASRSYTAPTSR